MITIEAIRLTPESLDWEATRIADANKATDEAIKKIVDYISRNNSGGVSYSHSGERGYGTSHIRFNEKAWQALKKLVE